MKMYIKKFYCLVMVFTMSIITQGCKKYLDKDPLGQGTEQSIFKDQTNAILAVNSIYDTASWDEGPKWGTGPYTGHMYEWMFGDVLSDDAEKGSTTSDFSDLQAMKEWRTDPANGIIATLWSHSFTGIFRSNLVINNVDAGTISATLKNRLKGEALFFRAYFYFYLARVFGDVPLFTQAAQPDDFGKIKRNSLAETYAFIEKDLKQAIDLLPEKSEYPQAYLGRATKGAARAYYARVIMYELGTDNSAKHTWQEVYDITNTIMQSNQYSLTPNYAQIQEKEGANNQESIFEIQFANSPIANGPAKSGTTNNVFQNNRSTWGYGFNNPTQSLVNEFEPNDPRLPCTVIKDGDVVLGIKNKIDLSGNATGYLNRKAAILQVNPVKSGDQNIRKMRYADVLLMHAEAAAQLAKPGEAVILLNTIRARARSASKPKGSTVGSLNYDANTIPAGTLPDLFSSIAGQDLLTAIWHERRVELGMEALHFWDLVRTGRYYTKLSGDVLSRCKAHSITGNVVNPVPVLPIPLNEVQTWNLQQNPGY